MEQLDDVCAHRAEDGRDADTVAGRHDHPVQQRGCSDAGQERDADPCEDGAVEEAEHDHRCAPDPVRQGPEHRNQKGIRELCGDQADEHFRSAETELVGAEGAHEHDVEVTDAGLADGHDEHGQQGARLLADHVEERTPRDGIALLDLPECRCFGQAAA